MKRKIKNKDALHLSRKIALYEGFLYKYLPQLTSLSLITRINLFDLFGTAGLDRLGSQGTPFIIFEALRKQRLHQLKNKLSLKPLSFTFLSAPGGPPITTALQQLQAANTLSSTCKLEGREEAVHDSLKQLFRQLQQQPAGDRNLLLLDPLGIPQFSVAELQLLSKRKLEIILFLPLANLWQMHQKPEKAEASAELWQLKKELDSLFPADHLYWTAELSSLEFMDCLKKGLQFQENLFTALEPSGAELPEAALFAMSSDGFMMEKMLHALQALRPAASHVPAGNQLGLFQGGLQEKQSTAGKSTAGIEAGIIALLREETNNQDMYRLGLQKGLLPAQLMMGLSSLINEQKIEVLDEKKKALSSLPAGCISFTAFKAPKPACYFRLRE